MPTKRQPFCVMSKLGHNSPAYTRVMRVCVWGGGRGLPPWIQLKKQQKGFEVASLRRQLSLGLLPCQAGQRLLELCLVSQGKAMYT